MRASQSPQSGFTLLEILLVVAAIAILAGIVILAINPNKQLGDTRNAQRRSDIRTILDAVYQYSIDNNGSLPANIGTTLTEICKTDAGACTDLIDLSALTASEKYLVTMPVDPICPLGCAGTAGTGYKIKKDTYNRITVSGPLAEQGAGMTITR